MLTRSPATMPWLVAPRVTAASPVSTPARAWMPGPSTRTASTSSSAARTARSASSSRAVGAPQTAITASPMNFSTVPAVARDHLAGDVEVAGERVADLLGVALLGEGREADEVGEQDRDEAALGDGCWGGGRRAIAAAVTPGTASVVPHSRQNFAPGLLTTPHDGQPPIMTVPHSYRTSCRSRSRSRKLEQLTPRSLIRALASRVADGQRRSARHITARAPSWRRPTWSTDRPWRGHRAGRC